MLIHTVKRRTRMENSTQQLVTKMRIGNTVYTVRPTFREGCKETAAAKMARLIEHETRLKAVNSNR